MAGRKSPFGRGFGKMPGLPKMPKMPTMAQLAARQRAKATAAAKRAAKPVAPLKPKRPAPVRTGYGRTAAVRRPEPVAARRYDFETVLVNAMDARMNVRLMCEGDLQYRTFSPFILYYSATGKVLIGGAGWIIAVGVERYAVYGRHQNAVRIASATYLRYRERVAFGLYDLPTATSHTERLVP